AILKTVHAEPRPGVLTAADLKAAAPRKLAAVCGAYRAYRVCGAPPPSSGGVATIELLGLFARARPNPVGANNPDDWAAFLWASRLAYADRDYYIADDRYAPAPLAALVSPGYLDGRAAAANLAQAAPAIVAPGDTGPGPWAGRWGRAAPPPESGTTHLSVVDAAGDAVALTASIEAPFGAQRMAAGFFLNNQLTDFSLNPLLNGKPVANAVAAGKKPRSSMSPTLVFDGKGDLYAVIGSPGGSAIIAYVAKTLVGVIDWKLSMQQAIELPNVVATGAEPRIEAERFPKPVADALAARGWKLRDSAFETSGLNGFVVTREGLDGGSDPRREGVARALTPPAR
ncbi:MAG: gamma-glutamyltransferase, partial [Hyphomonadaceae bacterium]